MPVVRLTLPTAPDGRLGPEILPVSLPERVLVSGTKMGLEGRRGGPALTLGDPDLSMHGRS